MSRVIPHVINNKVRDYLDMRMAQLVENDVDVWFGQGKTISLDGSRGVSGYFCQEPRELRVATGKPADIWFPVFIHETCHFDQWREGSSVWSNDTLHGQCVYGILDHQSKLIRRNVPLSIDAARVIRGIEEDCERRSVREIEKYDLPIDVSHYIKTANSYLYLHNLVGITQRWGKKGFSYQNKKILDIMPDTFQDNYDDMPLEYVKVYHECGY